MKQFKVYKHTNKNNGICVQALNGEEYELTQRLNGRFYHDG